MKTILALLLATLSASAIETWNPSATGGSGGGGSVTNFGVNASGLATTSTNGNVVTVNVPANTISNAATTVVSSNLNFLITNTIGRTWYVSPWGNDLTGDGSKTRPFKHVFDLVQLTNGAYVGANTVAQSGDTIILTPETHYQSVIPLADGVNLWIQPGATVFRNPFTNCFDGATVTNIKVGLTYFGPLIQPGNNSIITFTGARIITTNDPAGDGSYYDAGIGWRANGLVPPNIAGVNYGFTNRIVTNTTIYAGNGVGSTDFYYFVQTNTARSSFQLYGGKTLTGWDSLVVQGACDFTTVGCDMFATNNYSTGLDYSRAVQVLGDVKWSDTGSKFWAQGGLTYNYAVLLAGSPTVEFDGTSMFTIGGGTALVKGSATITGTHYEQHVAVGTFVGDFTGNGGALSNLNITTGTSNGVTGSGAVVLSTGNNQTNASIYGFLVSTNPATGAWVRVTNGIVTAGDTNGTATITLNGNTGRATATGGVIANGLDVGQTYQFMLHGAALYLDHNTGNFTFLSHNNTGTIDWKISDSVFEAQSSQTFKATTIYATNGFVLPSLTNSPPAATVGGAQLWSDGTNLCVIIRNVETGLMSTNKVTMTTWP